MLPLLQRRQKAQKQHSSMQERLQVENGASVYVIPTYSTNRQDSLVRSHIEDVHSLQRSPLWTSEYTTHSL